MFKIMTVIIIGISWNYGYWFSIVDADDQWPILLRKLTQVKLNRHWISMAVPLNLG